MALFSRKNINNDDHYFTRELYFEFLRKYFPYDYNSEKNRHAFEEAICASDELRRAINDCYITKESNNKTYNDGEESL